MVIGFYEADTCTTYPADTQSSKLSFAIWLNDDYTKDKPIGKIQVGIKETGRKAFKNLSGYYFFADLEKGNYTLTIEPELYLPEEMNVDTSAFSRPDKRVIEINGKTIALKPNSLYPFPANATLVRGQIESKSGNPVDGIKIGVKEEKSIESITDGRGEFVLYFKDTIPKDVILTISGETGPSIKVEEGKTVSAGKISIK